MKMYFWEVRGSEFAAGVMGLVSFNYIVMQAIWCFKFWNMTKFGVQFALASPLQILDEFVPLFPVIYAHGQSSSLVKPKLDAWKAENGDGIHREEAVSHLLQLGGCRLLVNGCHTPSEAGEVLVSFL